MSKKGDYMPGWYIEDGVLHLVSVDFRDGSSNEVLKVQLWDEGGEWTVPIDDKDVDKNIIQ